MARRDDFTSGTKDLLARRVGMRCSNPNCRQPTCGPKDIPTGHLSIGVAAHICAAAPGGPRYDANMMPAERRSADNGLWLCQNCAKLIDSDEGRFRPDVLREWKRLSEDVARLAIEKPSAIAREVPPDVELIEFYAQCFDRPAFQDHFHQEGSMEAFDKAIADTITALNTGALVSRDGILLQSSKGKVSLKNQEWRKHMDEIVDMLRELRSRYVRAKKNGGIHVDPRSDGTEFYCIYDHELAQWMDKTRSEIMRLFSMVADKAGVRSPVFPRHRRHW